MPIETDNLETQTDLDTNLSGGSGDTPVNDTDKIEKPSDLNVSDDFFKDIVKNDPDYAKILKENQSKQTDKSADADPSKAKKPEDTSGTPKTDDKAATDTDDQNTGTDADGKPQFEDNVIEGLKGEDFGKLSDDGQIAISNLLEKAETAQKELTEVQSKLSQYENDPIIKQRVSMLNSGKTLYDVKGFTSAEMADATKYLINKYGLDESDASGILRDLKSYVDTVIKDDAMAIASNNALQAETDRKVKETKEQGRKLFLGLSEFNKNLELKETNIERFYKGKDQNGNPVYNEAHPEIDKYRNGIEKIMKHCHSVGISYDHAIKMGPKQVYALAAAALDLPVSMNNQDQLQKIALEQKKQALSRFLRKGSGTLSIESKTSQAERQETKQNFVNGGYDVVRLANDPDYYEQCLAQKGFGDLEHKAKLDKLAEKGRAVEKERLKRKK